MHAALRQVRRADGSRHHIAPHQLRILAPSCHSTRIRPEAAQGVLCEVEAAATLATDGVLIEVLSIDAARTVHLAHIGLLESPVGQLLATPERAVEREADHEDGDTT